MAGSTIAAPAFRGGTGPECERFAAELLGLRHPPRSEGAVRPRAVFVQDDPARVVVSVSGREWTVDLLLEPRDDEREALTRTSRINLSYTSDGPAKFAPRLVQRLAERLDGTPYERLAEAVRELPGARCPSAGAEPVDSANERSPAGLTVGRASHQGWADSRDLRRFVGTAEDWQRAQHTLFQSTFPWARVLHGDLECVYVGAGDFLACPWQSPWLRRRGQERVGAGPLDPVAPLNLTTDLREREVILGTRPRLEATLEAARSRTDARMVMLNSTCVPAMLGEDVQGLASAKLEGEGRFVYFMDPSNGDEVDACALALDALCPEHSDLEADPRAVHLVGFHPSDGVDELCRWLEAAGVRVGETLLPRVSPEAVGRYGRARVQVLRGSEGWLPIVERAVGRLEMRSEVLPAPYGLRAVFDWLLSVAGLVGRAEEARTVVEERSGVLRDRWSRLRQDVGDHCVAFIATPEELESLRAPTHLFGVPVLPLVEEMGFRVEILDSSEEVDVGAWLRELAPSAVYSDYSYDGRLVASGCTPFSAQLFEMGPGGALRSFERLLRCCRLPFHRRFAGAEGGAE